jgi:5-methylcytosine-specific restriction endonuclease McrA
MTDFSNAETPCTTPPAGRLEAMRPATDTRDAESGAPLGIGMSPPVEPPRELNTVMRIVEIRYRDEYERWNVRLGSIGGAYTRSYLREILPFRSCVSCPSGRCPLHSGFRRRVVEGFWRRAIPWTQPSKCPRCGGRLAIRRPDGTWTEGVKPSVDHILPISKGGLEWDRDNLRWMCLVCNIKRGNRKNVPPGNQLHLEVP